MIFLFHILTSSISDFGKFHLFPFCGVLNCCHVLLLLSFTVLTLSWFTRWVLLLFYWGFFYTLVNIYVLEKICIDQLLLLKTEQEMLNYQWTTIDM